jgi:hypothetical protein
VTLAGTAKSPVSDLQFEVSLLKSRVTPTQTARLRITVTNIGEAQEVAQPGGQWCDPFNRDRGGSTPPGLWLHRVTDATEEQELKDRRAENCWTWDRPQSKHRGFPDYGCGRDSFAANEVRTYEYLVFDDYRQAPYFDPGTYRFDTSVKPGGEKWWLKLGVSDEDGQ